MITAPGFLRFSATCLLALILPALMLSARAEEPPAEPAVPEAVTEADVPPQPPVPRQIPYPHAARHLAIQEYLTLYQRHDEILPLISDEQAFYGLLLPGRSATPQGGVLILHDLEQHGQWPVLIAPLREELPDYGWTTLAIELPVPVSQPEVRPLPSAEQTAPEDENTEAATPPTAEDGPDEEVVAEEDDSDAPSAGSSAAQQEFDDDNEPALPRLEGLPPLPEDTTETGSSVPAAEPEYSVIVTQRIQTGLNDLYNRGQMNLVIIAIGDTAPLAANAVSVWQRERQEGKGITLIMIDARENAATQLPLNDALKSLEIPVLDLVTLDNQETDWQLKNRMGLMKRLKNDRYQQIILAGSTRSDPATVRRVRGWLKKNAAGTELPGS